MSRQSSSFTPYITILKRLPHRPRTTPAAEEDLLAACLCFRTHKARSTFGIGLVDPGGELQFSWFPMSSAIVQLWRSLYILDQIKDVKGIDTISACYHTVASKLGPSEYSHIRKIAEQIPVYSLRYVIMEESISDTDLDFMLAVCNAPDKHVTLDVFELERELSAGKINRTPELVKTFQLSEATIAKRREAARLSKIVIQSDQSFYEFCRDFRITHICSRPDGAYGYDWQHNFNDTLDRQIIFKSIQENAPWGIYCTQRPKHRKGFGRKGHPVVYIGINDTVVALKEVYYDEKHDKGMRIRTFDPKDPEKTGDLTVSYLRSLSPVMVGVTIVPDLHDPVEPSAKSIARGYHATRPRDRVLRNLMRVFCPI